MDADLFHISWRIEKGNNPSAILSLENRSPAPVTATVYFHKLNRLGEITGRSSRTAHVGPREKVQIFNELMFEQKIVFERVIVAQDGERELELAAPPPLVASAADRCFVATAIYRDAMHPDVVGLRAFRDDTLLPSPTGRRFVQWYYRHGPGLGRAVRTVPALRLMAVVLLVPAIKLVVHKRRKNSGA